MSNIAYVTRIKSEAVEIIATPVGEPVPYPYDKKINELYVHYELQFKLIYSSSYKRPIGTITKLLPSSWSIDEVQSNSRYLIKSMIQQSNMYTSQTTVELV